VNRPKGPRDRGDPPNSLRIQRRQHAGVVAFYNKRGTSERLIKEGKVAIKRLSCRTFVANAVQLQFQALAYNLGNFLRTLAAPVIREAGSGPHLAFVLRDGRKYVNIQAKPESQIIWSARRAEANT